MSRSVYVPSNALAVTYWHADDGDEFDFLAERLREVWPSLEPASGWVGREGLVLAVNRLAKIGVSEYGGIVALWIVPRDYYPELADRWCRQAAEKLEREFGELSLVGVASNGEAFYKGVKK